MFEEVAGEKLGPFWIVSILKRFKIRCHGDIILTYG